jgi:thiol-disulfide isomerase/thioredoxin
MVAKAAKTAKGKRKTAKKSVKSPQILTVDNLKKVPSLEKVLKSGKITVVLVFAEWCGACHRFRKNIWNPMCSRPASHNRVAIRDDMIRNTTLANAKFEYLPSLLVVDEKGTLQTFKSPDGDSNAMKTPKSLQEMEQVVNVPVAPTPAPFGSTPFSVVNPMQKEPAPEYLPVEDELEVVKTVATKTPKGITYKPTPFVAPQSGGAYAPQRGGALFQTLESVGKGIIPTAVLGGLALSMRGGTRKRSRNARRNTRRAY